MKSDIVLILCFV